VRERASYGTGPATRAVKEERVRLPPVYLPR
jgi:hypothetical protein